MSVQICLISVTYNCFIAPLRFWYSGVSFLQKKNSEEKVNGFSL